MDLQKYVGNMIKYYRELHNLNQEELGNKLKTSKQTISRYESGSRKPSPEILFDLADLFGIKIDDFFPNREDVSIEEVRENKSNQPNIIPIVREFAAGEPNYAAEDIIGYMTLPPSIKANEGLIYLEVTSDSMDKQFPVGSYVLVSTNTTVENGDIAVVKVNGEEAALKQVKFDEEKKKIFLVPNSYNDSHNPAVFNANENEVKLVGKVIGMYQSI